MDEYLQYMRTLRTQMNDVEDQAAKISVEEQMQITTIHSLEKDISSGKAEIKRLVDETDQMVKARGQICSKILENQKRVATLESDACTLPQTLELIQQERSNLSAKVHEKSTYYAKVLEELSSKYQEQQINEERKVQTDPDEFMSEIHGMENSLACNMGDGDKELSLKNLQTAKVKLDDIIHQKIKLVSENSKMKQTLDELRSDMHDLKAELSTMDMVKLEEEYQAIVSEKSGEEEYLQTLQIQVDKLKGILHVVRCGCGQEYKVEVGNI